jgi:hypothetical protein
VELPIEEWTKTEKPHVHKSEQGATTLFHIVDDSEGDDKNVPDVTAAFKRWPV